MATKPERIMCDNGCYKANRVAAENMESFRSTRNLTGIVAIDFGTTNCSVAFQTNYFKSSEEKPILLTMDSTGNGTRVPSSILFDKNGNMKSFGKDARDEYEKLPKTERPDYAFFERVKKEIQREKNVDRNRKIQAMNGKEYFLIDVIAHILCYLKNEVLDKVKDFKLLGCHPDIDWVITVPAIWKARGKRMMREAGYMAGLCDARVTMGKLEEAAGRVQPPPKEESNPEKLSLALEPESAAIECKKNISDNKKRNSVENYLIVDCGGGTVDIASHGIIDGHIHEIAPSAGNMSGSTAINERFRKFLSMFVDDPGFVQYLSVSDVVEKAKRVSDINKIVYKNFEDQKISFGNKEESRETFVVEIVSAFAKQFCDAMEEKAAKYPNLNVKIEEDGTIMRLTHEKMAELFQPTIDEISKLLCEHIHTYNLASMIDAVFWVGGFGGCKYLRRQLEAVINREFNKGADEILYSKLMEPQLAVVKGALAFRCDPSVIQQRKADATYGIACRIPFDKSIHRPQYCEDDEDDRSKKWCNNIFSTFIEKNESICTNEVFVANYSPAQRSQKVLTLTFYSTLDTNVWYTTDRGVTELAKMDVNIAGYGLDRDIEVVFDVTHTEIQVCARDKQSKNEYKIVVDFLFSQHK